MRQQKPGLATTASGRAKPARLTSWPIRRSLWAALAITAATLHAQSNLPAQSVRDQGQKASRAGDYFGMADMWRPLALKPDGQITNDGAWQQWAEAEALLTGEPPLRPLRPDAAGQSDADRATIARIEHAQTRDAIAEIVARARRTRIVILNEFHVVPRSRAFALEVARALRPLGYDVLAAETFSNDARPADHALKMAELTGDGYVRRRTGYYTHDPVFASFVQEALALGYRPVAYEATSYDPAMDAMQSQRAREQGQSDYLMTRAVKAYPKTKILIYAGHAHVAETPIEWDPGVMIAMMAARLKASSGIDPLTIDQTEFLRPAVDRTGIVAAGIGRAKRRSIVLIDRTGPVVVGQYAGGAVDLQVIHPRLPPVAGRPGWLAALGRKTVPVPFALYPASGRRLVQAYPAGAAEDAVPIDQVVVEAGRTPPVLMLNRRPYVLRVQDERAGEIPAKPAP